MYATLRGAICAAFDNAPQHARDPNLCDDMEVLLSFGTRSRYSTLEIAWPTGVRTVWRSRAGRLSDLNNSLRMLK